MQQTGAMILTPAARTAAAVIALIGFATFAVQIGLSAEREGSLSAGLWAMLRFFTILTNLLVLVSFTLMVARGRALPAVWLAGLTLWIVMVGVVFHLLLAGLLTLTGLAWWTDQGFHTITPALALLWWLVFAPKAGLTWSHAIAWLAWPLVYIAYALSRGAFDGLYPYPFIDLNTLAPAAVVVNVAGLSLAFFLAGLVVVGLARALSR